MYVTILIIIVPLIISEILYNKDFFDDFEDYIKFGSVIASIGGVILCIQLIMFINVKPVKVATPERYISQSYYIDSSNHLYIDKNDTTKPFGEDVSNKIEYKDSAKEPSIEFKTVKSKDEADHWIPFKIKYKTKTSVAKIILPKSTLTEKLTKVEVKNASNIS